MFPYPEVLSLTEYTSVQAKNTYYSVVLGVTLIHKIFFNLQNIHSDFEEMLLCRDFRMTKFLLGELK